MKRLFALCLCSGLMVWVGWAVVLPINCALFYNGSNTVQIGWNAYPGESYVIQTTTNLAQPWQESAPLMATNNSIHQPFGYPTGPALQAGEAGYARPSGLRDFAVQQCHRRGPADANRHLGNPG
jgi:hypothetical protein